MKGVSETVRPEVFLVTEVFGFDDAQNDAEVFERLNRGLPLQIDVAGAHVHGIQIGVGYQPATVNNCWAQVGLTAKHKWQAWGIEVEIVAEELRTLIEAR